MERTKRSLENYRYRRWDTRFVVTLSSPKILFLKYRRLDRISIGDAFKTYKNQHDKRKPLRVKSYNLENPLYRVKDHFLTMHSRKWQSLWPKTFFSYRQTRWVVGTNKTSGERKASNTLVTVVKYYNHYMVRSMLGVKARLPKGFSFSPRP